MIRLRPWKGSKTHFEVDITLVAPSGQRRRWRVKAPVSGRQNAERWAKAREQELLAQLLAPPPPPEVPPAPTFREFAETFMEACRADRLGKNTLRNYDGRRVVSASCDKTLRVWDCDTGRILHVLEGHNWSVDLCSMLGDGQRVVSVDALGTLRVWNCDTGQTLAVLDGHAGFIRSCTVLGDRRRVISASEGMILQVWDCDSGQLLHVLEGHTSRIRACAVLGDGRRVVSASDDKTLRVWDCDTGQSLRVLEGHTRGVNACAVLGDGRRVVSASDDKTLRVWDTDTGVNLGLAHGIEATALIAHNDQVVAGDSHGNVWFLEVRGAATEHEPLGSWFRRAFASGPRP